MVYERYKLGNVLLIRGPLICAHCGASLMPGDDVVYLERWRPNDTLEPFKEAVACNNDCATEILDMSPNLPYRYALVATVTSARPPGSSRIIPMPPERGPPSTVYEASDFRGVGEYRWASQVEREGFMDMKGEKPLIPAQDAPGRSIADFSFKDPEPVTVSEEETKHDLEMVFSARPIDPHNAVDDRQTKRITEDKE